MELESLYLYIISRLGFKKISEFEELQNHFGSFQAVYNSSEKDLLNFGWSSVFLDRWNKEKLNFDIDKLARSLESHHIQVLSYYDSQYPALLKQIFDAPSVLFYRGALISKDEACIAVVGTRMITGYGRAIMPRITQPLINSKITVVSGLAYGIDAAAHEEAIKNQARTIAVLGSGLDHQTIYPRQHVRLAEEILKNNGLLLSEHPPETPAFKQHFVSRNRIIAGMSLGTVIVECKLKSGALITADFAMDFNRPVYAVPGPIYSALSEGPHRLINDGAMLISSGEDVLHDLNLLLASPKPRTEDFTPLQLRVLKCMQSQPRTIDELQLLLHLSVSELISTLSSLELQGAVRNLGPQGFIKA